MFQSSKVPAFAIALAAVLAVCALAVSAQAPRVTLTGFAVMPADTFAAGPSSGAWLRAGKEGIPQFPSQPVQGFSALWPADARAGRWFVLADNGFGAKINSADALLRIYTVRVEWATTPAAGGGGVAVDPTFIQLADPDRTLPFPIVRGETSERWLTGGDLDPEAMVRMPDGTFWIGEEFGPFLLHVAADGRVLERPFEIPGVRSPDHPHAAPADAGQVGGATVRRSRGFESLALSGSRLYAALEGGLAADAAETRVYEFDLDKRAFTDVWWRYRFEGADHALTEFVALRPLSEDCRVRFLAIERDGGHGPAAKFKRVFEVLLNQAPMRIAGEDSRIGPVAFKRLVVDLLAIENPERLGGFATRFTFPFITTEAVWPTARDEIVLVNDNNFPAGGGRPGAARDATEFIQLQLPHALCTVTVR